MNIYSLYTILLLTKLQANMANLSTHETMSKPVGQTIMPILTIWQPIRKVHGKNSIT